MTAITGIRAACLNISSSLNMMSAAVTVPPALLMRTTRALTLGSSSAFFRASRKRTSSGTRGGGRADDDRLRLPFFAQKSRDVRQEDLRLAGSLDSPLLERLDPRGQIDRDERAAGREQKSQEGRCHPHEGSIPRGLNTVLTLWDNRRVVTAPLITIDDVRAAAQRLAERVYRTPVISSQPFDDASGCRVFFKCESLQRAGSFKIRGALNKLVSLTSGARSRG